MSARSWHVLPSPQVPWRAAISFWSPVNRITSCNISNFHGCLTAKLSSWKKNGSKVGRFSFGFKLILENWENEPDTSWSFDISYSYNIVYIYVHQKWSLEDHSFFFQNGGHVGFWGGYLKYHQESWCCSFALSRIKGVIIICILFAKKNTLDQNNHHRIYLPKHQVVYISVVETLNSSWSRKKIHPTLMGILQNGYVTEKSIDMVLMAKKL